MGVIDIVSFVKLINLAARTGVSPSQGIRRSERDEKAKKETMPE
jgi:hypothetical protein